MSAGIVPALTKIACAVGDAKIFGSAHLLHALLASIGVYFFPSPSYIGISQALAAGLLRAIINSGPMKETDEQTSAWHMLGVTLPASTVFYSVVAQLPAAFLEAKDLIDAPSLKSLPIYSLWQPFHAIAQERINLMQLFTSKKLVSSKACDTVRSNAQVSSSAADITSSVALSLPNKTSAVAPPANKPTIVAQSARSLTGTAAITAQRVSPSVNSNCVRPILSPIPAYNALIII
jgi:hypothetical protein